MNDGSFLAKLAEGCPNFRLHILENEIVWDVHSYLTPIFIMFVIVQAMFLFIYSDDTDHEASADHVMFNL